MKLISMNIGEKKTVSWKDKEVVTGIFKAPVYKPIYLGKEDVLHDNVVDRRFHGGVNKAVYGYSFKNYGYFKERHPDLDWKFGMFGENLTFSDLNEEEITVGSVYELGECILQVTEPRQPCFKLGIRFNSSDIISQFWNTTKSGIYFKVLRTGFVKCNDELLLLKKLNSTPTIAEVFTSKYG
jgi:MOSC domain-containing protein YiiM